VQRGQGRYPPFYPCGTRDALGTPNERRKGITDLHLTVRQSSAWLASCQGSRALSLACQREQTDLNGTQSRGCFVARTIHLSTIIGISAIKDQTRTTLFADKRRRMECALPVLEKGITRWHSLDCESITVLTN
jgi:hypothetical protein